MNYSKLYNNLISYRKSNPPLTDYTEIHHIVPKCMGGTDSVTNLVKLTAREHYLAHRLLYKANPNINGLAVAFYMMSNLKSSLINSKDYESARRIWSKVASETLIRCHQDENYVRNKSEHTTSFWASENGRSKMITGMKKSWENRDRKRKQSECTKIQMSTFESKQISVENLKKVNGDCSWNTYNARENRDYWGLADLCWELTKYNPNNESVHMFAKEFSMTYDCGQRMQLYQNMHNRFKKGWVPRDDQKWLRDFGHLRL